MTNSPLNVTLLKGMHLINNMIIDTCSIGTSSRMNWNTKSSTKFRWKIPSWWLENIYGLKVVCCCLHKLAMVILLSFFNTFWMLMTSNTSNGRELSTRNWYNFDAYISNLCAIGRACSFVFICSRGLNCLNQFMNQPPMPYPPTCWFLKLLLWNCIPYNLYIVQMHG
jgi:hypothetical protein